MRSETPERIHFAAIDPATGSADTIVTGYAEGGIVHLDRAVRIAETGAMQCPAYIDYRLPTDRPTFEPPQSHVVEIRIDPERLAEFAHACGAAAHTLREGLTPALTAVGESMRQASDGLRAAIREAAPDPDWPAPERAVCAHVCGADAGHRCDARATTSLRFTLPSGGTRDLPLCGACALAENAAASVTS